MAQGEKEHGEGNYKASRDYNERTKRFVESGRVEDAARNAEPGDEREAAELDKAEAEGKARAKEEDPEVVFGTEEDREASPQGVRITDRPADQTSTPAPGRG
jgi:hypothetical protein